MVDETPFVVGYLILKHKYKNKSNPTFSKEALTEALMKLDTLDHLRHDTVVIGSSHIRVYDLIYPEVIRAYAEQKGWIKITR